MNQQDADFFSADSNAASSASDSPDQVKVQPPGDRLRCLDASVAGDRGRGTGGEIAASNLKSPASAFVRSSQWPQTCHARAVSKPEAGGPLDAFEQFFFAEGSNPFALSEQPTKQQPPAGVVPERAFSLPSGLIDKRHSSVLGWEDLATANASFHSAPSQSVAAVAVRRNSSAPSIQGLSVAAADNSLRQATTGSLQNATVMFPPAHQASSVAAYPPNVALPLINPVTHQRSASDSPLSTSVVARQPEDLSGTWPFQKAAFPDKIDSRNLFQPSSPEALKQGLSESSTDNRFRPHQSGLWSSNYKALQAFVRKHGHSIVPLDTKNPEMSTLARWIKRQRHQYKLMQEGRPSTMTPDRVTKLEEIGFVWDFQTSAWMQRLGELKDYKAKYGNCNVPTNHHNRSLATWVKCQRRNWKLLQEGKQSTMTQERIVELERIGFEWELRAYRKARADGKAASDEAF